MTVPSQCDDSAMTVHDSSGYLAGLARTGQHCGKSDVIMVLIRIFMKYSSKLFEILRNPSKFFEILRNIRDYSKFFGILRNLRDSSGFFEIFGILRNLRNSSKFFEIFGILRNPLEFFEILRNDWETDGYR
jgi:hypothetical protein